MGAAGNKWFRREVQWEREREREASEKERKTGTRMEGGTKNTVEPICWLDVEAGGWVEAGDGRHNFGIAVDSPPPAPYPPPPSPEVARNNGPKHKGCGCRDRWDGDRIWSMFSFDCLSIRWNVILACRFYCKIRLKQIHLEYRLGLVLCDWKERVVHPEKKSSRWGLIHWTIVKLRWKLARIFSSTRKKRRHETNQLVRSSWIPRVSMSADCVMKGRSIMWSGRCTDSIDGVFNMKENSLTAIIIDRFYFPFMSSLGLQLCYETYFGIEHHWTF